MRLPLPLLRILRVLGVNDFALKRHRRYATILTGAEAGERMRCRSATGGTCGPTSATRPSLRFVPAASAGPRSTRPGPPADHPAALRGRSTTCWTRASVSSTSAPAAGISLTPSSATPAPGNPMPYAAPLAHSGPIAATSANTEVSAGGSKRLAPEQVSVRRRSASGGWTPWRDTAVSWSVPTLTGPLSALRSKMSYGMAFPIAARPTDRALRLPWAGRGGEVSGSRFGRRAREPDTLGDGKRSCHRGRTLRSQATRLPERPPKSAGLRLRSVRVTGMAPSPPEARDHATASNGRLTSVTAYPRY
ncbi:hypothetical protein HD596_005118 [Nonomuraea jabiensis]|uniref:Uncharacterized protein n=1 Tax=Nonomuraea jabiensis TaxID=882448 RepID=A0A7W9LC26_9ACTN|nr:hypothetical protein [Nonomuraea jabiensis]